jgi:hypothetical protein
MAQRDLDLVCIFYTTEKRRRTPAKMLHVLRQRRQVAPELPHHRAVPEGTFLYVVIHLPVHFWDCACSFAGSVPLIASD